MATKLTDKDWACKPYTAASGTWYNTINQNVPSVMAVTLGNYADCSQLISSADGITTTTPACCMDITVASAGAGVYTNPFSTNPVGMKWHENKVDD